MLTRIANFYNEQDQEDKAIIWMFMFIEFNCVFLAVIFFVIYSALLAIANDMYL